ncbi:MAG TPA: phosphatase PAP2 family protein [Bacteroidota bacterium]|nr:phosphatase PAP2 family protein [Bacteroidota bacterium]
MIDFLYSLDVAVFHFINGTLANPAGDLLWPLVTDYDRLLPVRILLVAVWLLLIIRGGTRGRTAALLLIPVLFCADKISSVLIKDLVSRARPCAEIGGVPIVQGIHMLVDCGPGKSFPSSHAVNNFAVATLFARYYSRWRWAFYSWAALVALSRPAVGVHYPSDILGGAVIGSCVALAVTALWTWTTAKYFPRLAIAPAGPGVSVPRPGDPPPGARP